MPLPRLSVSVSWLATILLSVVCAQFVLAQDPREVVRARWHEIGDPAILYLAPSPYSPAPAGRQIDQPKAKELTKLAREAAELGEAALAIRLATEAAYWDPDCDEARTILGYEQHEGQWLTPFQLRMARRGEEWHPRFGWVAPADLPRYEQGERKRGRRWVTVEMDASQHETIGRGWQVRTDNFVVTTNHSLEAGAALVAKLEELYQVWQQLFADYHMTATELRRRFEAGQTPGPRSRPFSVLYHRSREEYIAELSQRQPRIGETLGIYFDQFREAHFYFVPGEDNDPTLYHEAVHQLFYESIRSIKGPGQRDNFWVVEGAALYFETLRRHEDPDLGVRFTIGQRDAGRLPVAIERLTKDGYYIPLATLVSLGQRDFQQRDDLPRLYGQATGIATWLMADPMRQRTFVDYLKAFYTGRTEPTTLATLLEKTYPQLDAEFREFLSR